MYDTPYTTLFDYNKIQNGAKLSTPNTPMQLHSRWSFRPPANGLANVLTFYKGYSAIQVPHPLHLTYRIAPFRDGSNIVKTTSALVGPLGEILLHLKTRAKDNKIGK